MTYQRRKLSKAFFKYHGYLKYLHRGRFCVDFISGFNLFKISTIKAISNQLIPK